MSELIYYISEFFSAYELVDRETYNKRGDKSFQLFDSRLLWTMDQIKLRFQMKTIIVNNWWWSGGREWSGLRTVKSPYYNPYSQHTLGKAIDFYIEGINSKIVRDDIIENPFDHSYKYITAIEDFDGMSWVHIDIRNWNKPKNGLLVFSK